MPGRLFYRLLRASQARRLHLAGAVAVLLSLSGVLLSYADYDSDLTTMLPHNERLNRAVRFLRTSELSESVLVSLGLTSDEHGLEYLEAATEQFVHSLTSPLVKKAEYRFSGENSFNKIVGLAEHIPEFFTDDVRAALESQLTPGGIRKMLHGHFTQLLSPASPFTSELMRVDPFGLLWDVLEGAKKAALSSGHNVELRDGFFVSEDEEHTLVLIQSAVPVTDVYGSRELITFLEDRIRDLPPHVSCDMVAGHRRTISNEDIIKRDIRILSLVGMVLFPLLLLAGFRDWRSVVVFIIPVLAMTIALGMTSLFFDAVALFILGMGVVMLGITIDYGIHVFIAIRSTSDPVEGVMSVARPMAIGGGTTVTVFAVFIFSSIPAYRQFAVFASLTILLSLGLALLLVPAMYGKPLERSDRTGGDPGERPRSRIPPVLAAGVWGAVVLAAVLVSLNLQVGSDMARYDGTSREVLDEEKRFYNVWRGNESLGIIVSEDRDLDKALATLEDVLGNIEKEAGGADIASITAIWPSKRLRLANAERWSRFWNEDRRKRLGLLLSEHGREYGFSEDTFDPFIGIVNSPVAVKDTQENSGVFDELFERFVMPTEDGYQVLAFFNEADPGFPAIQKECRSREPVQLVSRREFDSLLHETFASNILMLLLAIGISIPAFIFIFFRKFLLSLVALIPVITGVLGVCAACVLAGVTFDGAIACGGLIVVGLCIDYGVFFVHHCRGSRSVGTPVAVSLSAITTALGACVLLTARHPALFPFGFTLMSGIPAAYIAAVTVVPSLVGALERKAA